MKLDFDPPLERSAYGFINRVTTRWADNDIYGHLNNTYYQSVFDTTTNLWLIREGGLDIARGAVIGVAAESATRFLAEITYPEAIDVGVRVRRLGRSSCIWEMALWRADSQECCALGHFVHVFIGRETRKSVEIPPRIRACLERLMADRPAA